MIDILTYEFDKTSTITSIAACFNLNICVINMGSQNMTDDRLQYMFSTVPKNCMIVLEVWLFIVLV